MLQKQFKREVYSNKSLPQETRKISNKQANFTPKGTRERRINKTQNQQKERNRKDHSRRKEIIKTRQKINKIEFKKNNRKDQ